MKPSLNPAKEFWVFKLKEDEEYLIQNSMSLMEDEKKSLSLEKELKQKAKTKEIKLTPIQKKKKFLEDAINGKHEDCMSAIDEGLPINTCVTGAPYEFAFSLFCKSIKIVNEKTVREIKDWLDRGAWIKNFWVYAYKNEKPDRLSQDPKWTIEGDRWLKAWNQESQEYRNRIMNRALEKILDLGIHELRMDGIITYKEKDKEDRQKWEVNFEQWKKEATLREAENGLKKEDWDVFWLTQYGDNISLNHEALKNSALEWFGMNPWIDHAKAYQTWFSWSLEWNEKINELYDYRYSTVYNRVEDENKTWEKVREGWGVKCQEIEQKYKDKVWENPWFWVKSFCEKKSNWAHLEEFGRVWGWKGVDFTNCLNEVLNEGGDVLESFNNHETSEMLKAWIMDALDKKVEIHHDIKNFLFEDAFKKDDVSALKKWIQHLGSPKGWVKKVDHGNGGWGEEHWVETAIESRAKKCLKWLDGLPSFKASQDYYKDHTISFQYKDWRALLMFNEVGFDITQSKDSEGRTWLASWIDGDFDGPRVGYASVIRVHPVLLDQGGLSGESLLDLVDAKQYWGKEVKEEFKKSLTYQAKNILKKEMKPKKIKDTQGSNKVLKARRL